MGVVEEKGIRRRSNASGNNDDDDFLGDLADDAIWKRIQQNTFARWANEQLKTVNKYVACLETDLSDGIRLLALVEVLSGKKLPKYNLRPTMKAQKLNNVDLALKFLQDEEKIKLVNISSTDIVDVWVGEDDFDASLTPKQRLLKWIQNKIGPDVSVNNFTTDWNDARAIGALIDSVAPGLCPDWQDWKPEDNVKNIETALQLADDWLDVPQLIKPKEMANRKVDELAMMTYLSQFPGAKLKANAPLKSSAGNPARVRCYGQGLAATGNVVNAETHFIVETFSAGKGKVQVSCVNPDKGSVPVSVKFNEDKNMTYSCGYLPEIEGEHLISVMFNKTEVPKSPFKVQIKGVPTGDGHKKCKARGPAIASVQATGDAGKTGDDNEPKVRAGKQTHIDIEAPADAGAGQLEVMISDAKTGKPAACACRVRKMSDEKFRAEFVPEEAGTHAVEILFAGKPIPSSPFLVHVDPFRDARKVKCAGRGLEPSGVRVGDVADFEVSTEHAGDGELQIKIIKPDGTEYHTSANIKLSQENDKKFECDWKPEVEGDHKVVVCFGGQEVRSYNVHVAPPSASKSVAFGPGLHGGCVGVPNKFIVDTKGEKGTLGIECNGPSEAKITCQDLGNGLASVEWTVNVPGAYPIHVTLNGEDIPNSPSCAKISSRKSHDQKKFDDWFKRRYSAEYTLWTSQADKQPTSFSSSCVNLGAEASGGAPRAPTGGKKVIAGLPSVVTIKMSDLSDLNAFIETPSNEKKECQLIPKDNGTLTISFTPDKPGTHLVHLMRGDRVVSGSPFRIEVEGRASADATKVKVLNNSNSANLDELLNEGKLNVQNSFLIDIRDAGKGKVGVSMHGPSKAEVDVSAGQTSGVFKVTWQVSEPGKYNLSLRFDNVEIPNSPFKIKVKKPSSAE